MAKRILVPVDLSHRSSWTAALPQAFELAAAGSVEVVVMTVVPEVAAGLDWRYTIRGETGGSEDLDIASWLEQARARLEEIGTEFAPPGTSFEVLARYGTIYEQILEVADELGVDQIVMAANRPSLSDYLIGPNAARVVRHAKCSVQIVRG